MVGWLGTERSRTYTLVADGPMLPTASVARTSKVYEPSSWGVRSGVAGAVQAAQSAMTVAPEVTRHSVVAPGSAVKSHVGVGSLPGVVGVVVKPGATGAVVSST